MLLAGLLETVCGLTERRVPPEGGRPRKVQGAVSGLLREAGYSESMVCKL